MASALFYALGAGFVLATLAPLAATGTLPWQTHYGALVQAHGAAQLEGFAGLFVMGMGLRLAPRFSGVPQPPERVAFAIFGLVAGGLALRLLGQVFSSGASTTLLRTGAVLTTAGHLGFGATLIGILWAGRRHRTETAWWLLTFGAVATIAWGLVSAVGQWRASEGLVEAANTRATTWLALLGGIGAFTWGVQAQTVPVFYGRKRPPIRRVGVPAAALAAGCVLTVAGALARNDALVAPGFLLAGLAVIAITVLTGAITGSAHRLRPRAQPMARFILAANRWALVSGGLLAVTGVRIATGATPAGMEDAARHALTVGFITGLIIGMASLVAPMFAVERVVPGTRRAEVYLAFPALQAAAVLRVGAALLAGEMSESARQHTLALSGALAWFAVATFAYALIRAVRNAPKAKGIIIAMVETREG